MDLGWEWGADVGWGQKNRCEARSWLDAPPGIEGMFVEFREEMRGVTQVLLSSANGGEGPGGGVNDNEVWRVVWREKAWETGLEFTRWERLCECGWERRQLPQEQLGFIRPRGKGKSQKSPRMWRLEVGWKCLGEKGARLLKGTQRVWLYGWGGDGCFGDIQWRKHGVKQSLGYFLLCFNKRGLHPHTLV